MTDNDIRAKGGHVMENSKHLPFKPFRAFMYTVDELQEKDGEIYKFYLEKQDVISTSQQSIHGTYLSLSRSLSPISLAALSYPFSLSPFLILLPSLS
jgi:hypothetical protein